jgi:murein L,D-transpeptidase YcbB/YkuD
MGGAGSVQLTGSTIPPGSSVDASINLIAPASGGTYQGNYRLQSSDGKTFGIGPTANNVFYVKIVVESQNEQADNNDQPPVIPVLTRNMKLTNPMMVGNDVKMLQNRLLDLGYNGVGAADGKFGPKTDTAVRAFQGDNGLVVDGIVGKKTWTALWD